MGRRFEAPPNDTSSEAWPQLREPSKALAGPAMIVPMRFDCVRAHRVGRLTQLMRGESHRSLARARSSHRDRDRAFAFAGAGGSTSSLRHVPLPPPLELR